MKPKYLLAGITISLACLAVSALGAELSVKASALPAELRPGLVLYYSFDNEPSATEIADESGQGNDGSPVNVEWVKDGHQGEAASFGLTNSYITVPNKANLNPPLLTLSAWIKTSYSDWVWRRIFDKGTTKGYVLSMCGDTKGDSKYRGLVDIEVGKTWAHSGIQVTDGQWHHVVGTFDGTDAKVFVDGWFIGKRGHWAGEVSSTTYNLTIGANRSNPKADLGEVGASFNGIMDDVMMFNRALSDDEIQALFKVQGGTLGPKPEKPAPSASKQKKQIAPEPDVNDRLKQVKQLLDQGLIDKEGYDRKVKEIVDSI